MPSILIGIHSIDFQRFDLTEKNFEKKIFCLKTYLKKNLVHSLLRIFRESVMTLPAELFLLQKHNNKKLSTTSNISISNTLAFFGNRTTVVGGGGGPGVN